MAPRWSPPKAKRGGDGGAARGLLETAPLGTGGGGACPQVLIYGQAVFSGTSAVGVLALRGDRGIKCCGHWSIASTIMISCLEDLSGSNHSYFPDVDYCLVSTLQVVYRKPRVG